MRILIIGAGEVGYNIASRLVAEGEEVTVIENNPVRKQYCTNTLDVLVFEGSGSNPRILKAAGIEHTDLLIAVTTSDEVNITACLLAKIIAPKSTRIARIRNSELSKISELYGISNLNLALTLYPEGQAAEKVLALLQHGGAIDYLPFSDGRFNVIGIPVSKDSPIVGQKLMELGQNDWWRQKVLLSAVQRGTEVLIPRGNLVINAKDILYTVTTPQTIDEVTSLLGYPSKPLTQVMIYGSTDVALAIVNGCLDLGLKVKLIEPSATRCEELAAKLPEEVLVLHGEATDESLLRAENIKEMSAFITCSDVDESNVVAAVLAKRMGNDRVMVITNKLIFMSILAANGIQITISPSSTAVGSILQFVRLGRVLSVQPFFDDSAEFIVFVVPEGAPIAGQQLRSSKLPHESIITFIRRGDNDIIPRGDTTIEAGDRVLVFTQRKAVHKVEQLFSAEVL